jgi:predicted membrane-bound spermidine synthase
MSHIPEVRPDGVPARTAFNPPGGIAWRHVPHVIFFLSCACIMVVELVAGRLISGHLGSSLYTWTAVIGVMLAGITAGNVVGGRLADRYRPEAILAWLFLAAGSACLVALALNGLFAAARPLRGLHWPLQILLSVLAIFILPAALLGTLSPSLAKMAVARGRRVGSTLGSFYAAGTAGSIAGTFLTGFWLIFALGNTRVILATAAILALLGAVVRWGIRPLDSRTFRALDPRTSGPSDGPVCDILGRPYAPHAIALVASVCLMVVELLASRIIAEQAGSSLYTWTSVIGVVLAGMSIGNYLGGVLSDRFRPARFIGWLFLAASASVVGVLVLTSLLSTNEPFARWQWPAMVFATVFCIFFVPSVLLGTFGPAATKVAVQRTMVVGTTIGSVSAWNAAGSIVGTIAAGFWLIPALGTRSLTMFVASVLAVAGVVLGPRRRIQVAWTALAIGLFVLTRASVPALADWTYLDVFQDTGTDPFRADSAYQAIRVYEEQSDKDTDRTLRVLSLDHLIHGYVDMKDPSYLNYDYERVYADITRRYGGDKRRVSAFFVGGGSYTFPRWLLTEWPGSETLVAEIDPMVLEANHQATGLPPTTPIRTIVGDARNVVDDLPPGRQFDFFFGDAFNDLAVPYHLTTLEFSRRVAAHLKPDGAYMVNLIDNYETGLLLGSFVGTLQQVFRHVYVFCTEQDGVVNRRDTFVVAASNVPLDTRGWEPHHQGDFDGSVLTAANLTELRKKCGGRVLTDDDAPVEVLIAPVVRERTGKDR